jgi:zinc ribbon protein
MKCPRCGTPNEPGDRYCSSCGAQLTADPQPKEEVPTRERLQRLIGGTPRARWTTAATVLAIVVAVVAFIALKPSEESIPRDAYTVKADRICLESKRSIAAVEQKFTQQGQGSVAEVARELVPVVAAWRNEMDELAAPSDRTELAGELEGALLEAEVQIGGLARAASGGGKRETLAKAKDAEAASAAVEEAVEALGLSHCAEVAIGLASNPD